MRALPLKLTVISLFVLAAQATPARADNGSFPGGGVTQADVGSFATPYPSPVVVGGLTGTISDVNLTLNDFTTNGASSNIDFLLVSPNGTHIVPVSDVGGANSAGGVDLVLDDSAADSLPTASALTSGTFKPTDAGGGEDDFNDPAPAAPHGNLLSDFNGGTANGTWKLFLTDDFFMQSTSASISSWVLTITTQPPPATPPGNPASSINPAGNVRKRKCKKKKQHATVAKKKKCKKRKK